MTIFEKRQKLAEARERRESIEQENIEISQSADSSEETLLEAADILISDSNRVAKAVNAIVKEQENVEMDDGEQVPAMGLIRDNIDEIQEYIPRLLDELGIKTSDKDIFPLPKMAGRSLMDLSDWFRFFDQDMTEYRTDIILMFGPLHTMVASENNLDAGDKKQLARDTAKLMMMLVSFLKAAGVPDEYLAEAIDNENKMES